MDVTRESHTTKRPDPGTRPAARVRGSVLLAALLLGAVGCGGGGRPRAAVEPDAPEAISFEKDPGAWRTRVAEARSRAVLDPREPYWNYELGVLYAGVDSLEISEQHFLRSLALDPGYAPALTRLTRMYYESGRSAEAVEILETSRALYDGEEVPAVLLAALALNCEAVGNVDRAKEIREELAHASGPPSSVTPYLYLKSPEFREARVPAEAALVASPGSAANYNNYGITRLQEGKPIEAREAFATAHDLDPLLPGPLYNLALVERFYFMNDEKAKQWFDRYWDLSHEDPDRLRGEFYGDETQP